MTVLHLPVGGTVRRCVRPQVSRAHAEGGLTEHFFHSGHGLVAHPRYDVAVGVEGDGDVGVPEKLLEVASVNFCRLVAR